MNNCCYSIKTDSFRKEYLYIVLDSFPKMSYHEKKQIPLFEVCVR